VVTVKLGRRQWYVMSAKSGARDKNRGGVDSPSKEAKRTWGMLKAKRKEIHMGTQPNKRQLKAICSRGLKKGAEFMRKGKGTYWKGTKEDPTMGGGRRGNREHYLKGASKSKGSRIANGLHAHRNSFNLLKQKSAGRV